MSSESESTEPTGQTISLTIPAQEPKIFNYGATNDVLTLLVNNRYDAYSIRQLTEFTEYATNSVRNAVDTLLANDLVVESGPGNQRRIQINQDRIHVPDDPFLRIPQPEFIEPARAATHRFKDELPDVAGIVLYGSVARGEADRRSDIDLWILTTGDRGPAQRKANPIARELEETKFNGNRYDFHVDVESVQGIPRYAEDIRDIVLSGITVYQSEPFQKVRNLLAHTEEIDEE